MCNKALIKTVKEIQNQDMSHFNELYGEFEKLLRYYERKLGYDDAGQELTLFLIELIYGLDTDKFKPDDTETLKRYIAVSVRNQYILLSKRNQRYILSCNELYDNLGHYCLEPEDGISISEGLKLLSERQRLAVAYRYIYGFSDAEIADMLSVSRQAVNRLETRGLAVLREYYLG